MKKIISGKSRYGILSACLFVLMVALMGSFLSGIFNNSAKAAADAIVFFDPAEKTVTVGETFTLVAKIDPGTNQIIGATLNIQYDESIIRLDSITKSATFNTQLTNNIPDPADGTATLSVGNIGSPPTYVTTTSDIATFTFTALMAGSVDVIFVEGTKAVDGTGTNLIGSMPGSAVTVGAVPHETYNSTDVSHLISNWLQTIAGGSAVGDVNLDGKVDSRDLGIMMSYWQN